MTVAKQRKYHPQGTAPAKSEFWRGASFEDLARQQGVRPVERLEALLGGWPEDEVNDGFEAALERWRQESLRGKDA
ncbi:MAG TPA: hypothetical protein VIE43_10665 [Thermoanaerobaculia bacterium]|jgi:hypothetical protein|nr:hypothetical protein [Thermoanaerobaculia bacterium]